VLKELCKELKEILSYVIRRNANPKVCDRVLRNQVLGYFTKAIPFGTPIQTDVTTVCGEFA